MTKIKTIKDLFEIYSLLPSFSGVKITDVNQRGAFNDTPLHIASVRGYLNEIKLLLMNGADINAQGEHGYTPIHEAIEQHNLEVSKHLRDCGADCNIKNDDGFTAIELAKILDINLD